MKISHTEKKSRWRPNPPQVLAFGFIAIIMIGAVLLSMPFSSASGKSQPFLDALFMSTSATCVTGLSLVTVAHHYTAFGEVVLLLLVQIGGLGFMTMASLISIVFGRKISFRERMILQEAMNQGSLDGIVRLIRKVLVYALTIELAGAILLTVRLLFEMPIGTALYFGVYHSISIFNNAGFDLFTGLPGRLGSLQHYVNDPFVNLVSVLLIILGGIGFIVIADLLAFPRTRKLSLHSMVVLSMTGLLIVVGTIVIFIFEYTNPATMQPLSHGGKLLASMFQSVSARSAGLATVDTASLRQATQFFIVILMFIGAAPGSSGGGIKVTTFAILVGVILAMLRGKEDVVMFHRRLPKERIYKAITFTMFSFIAVILSAMVLSTTENFSFLGILFETVSAYGTCGMSMGLTPSLSSFGKGFLSVIMFIGRLGPITLAFALTPKPEKELFRYPEGNIRIG
ncbi:TrkH family potassium uptake protein [Gorillibacterium massiliense]|uniref:TrkH family potassium uptake protein n=1 Tax=Gorillibacterium massiliense TaxID=1280390 RepID=UPI0004B0E1D0|nr:TrkH family potassium uptake protein [Gorillibacterium massiliense]